MALSAMVILLPLVLSTVHGRIVEAALYTFNGSSGPFSGVTRDGGKTWEPGEPIVSAKPGETISWITDATFARDIFVCIDLELTELISFHVARVESACVHAEERPNGPITRWFYIPADTPPAEYMIQRHLRLTTPGGRTFRATFPAIFITVTHV